jgi:hypothetical protein
MDDEAIITYRYHSNKYSADSACEHCEGIIRHEPWCITENLNVRYAYDAFLDASKLAQSDHLILHALGAVWQDFQSCRGNCGIKQDDPQAPTSLVRLG